MRKFFGKFLASSVCLLGQLFLFLPFAFASAEGHHGGHHQPSFSDIIPFWINFSVYVVVLFVLLKKPLKSGWLARRSAIEEAVSRAERAYKEASEKLHEAKGKLAGLEQEIVTIRDAIAAEAEREAGEILSAGKKRAELIGTNLRETIEMEERAAERAVREEVADYVISKVRDRLINEIDPTFDKSLREAALSGAGRLVN
ncbi:MAG: hypothetical protein D6719_02440 [Candidatus Dadabacteria bacterium]|nr:MAG: hypothetical protein D6719_02440 [Candidatus Dadabacteria bacterium]